MSETFNTKKVYIVLCEGSSEYAYIQILNRILDEHNISIVLKAVILGNGHFKTVKKKVEAYNYKERKKLKIWIDEDIYKRNEQQNYTKYLKYKSKMPDFLFTQYNFEDFLIMHLDDKIITEWQEKLIKRNHFNVPLISDEYIDLLKKNMTIFKDYQKGVIPDEIQITFESIKHSYEIHINSNIKFKSNFLDFIHKNVIRLT